MISVVPAAQVELVYIRTHLQLYDLGQMATLAELPGAFILGAGAGSSRVAGFNCEVRGHHVVPGHMQKKLGNKAN